jgi:hypothetical protein
MRKLFFITLLLLLTGSFLLTGCKKKSNGPSWNTELLTPLLHGSLSMNDIAGDSLLESDADGQLSLVFRNTLFNLNLNEDYIHIPDTSLRQAVSLDSIRLPNRSIFYPISLGQLARADQSGTGALIIALHGSTAPIPAIGSLSNFDQDIDATDFFEVAVLDSGYMDIQVRNGFPVDITDLIYRLKNKSDGTVVVEDTIPLIPKKSTIFRSHNLAGKTVEGNLLADIVNMGTPGSGTTPVKIDTNDAIELSISVRDLKVLSAKAIFPAQNLVNIKNEVQYVMNGPELTYTRVRSGKLVISAVNTIEDSLFLHYRIPGALDPTGKPIDIYSTVAPAPQGGSVTLKTEFDLAGYSIDLTGKNGLKTNTFYNEFTARIDSTGKLINISLEDSILVYYGLLDLIPEYVKGYAGQHQIEVGPEKIRLGFFDNFKSGKLDLEKVNIDFRFINDVGVDANFFTDYIRGINPQNGTSVDLNAPFIKQNLSINRAFENPFVPGITSFELNNGNSNAKTLFESLPDELAYHMNVEINPKGNYFNYQDFVDFSKNINVFMDMEIPLSLQADKLLLMDTLDFSVGENNLLIDINAIDFLFSVDNSFPLDATAQVYFVSPSGIVLDSLFSKMQFIKGGIPEGQDCKVKQTEFTKINASFDQTRTSNIQTATKAIIKVAFSTPVSTGCAGYLKIYNDYLLEFNLSAKFNYKVN